MADPEIREASGIDAAMVVLRAASGALVHINNGRHCAHGYDGTVKNLGVSYR
jgi:myo-inositol 2-dehydrogenase/D-chiro-inositol 1-dehydrogenase